LLTPKTLEQAYNRFANEQRAIDYVVLDRAKAGDVAPPSPDAITGYFEENKACSARPSTAASSSCRSRPATLRAPRT